MLEEITRGHRGLQRLTGDCKSLQGIARVYRVLLGLQGYKGDYKGSHWITRDNDYHKRLQEITRGYRTTGDYKGL